MIRRFLCPVVPSGVLGEHPGTYGALVQIGDEDARVLHRAFGVADKVLRMSSAAGMTIHGVEVFSSHAMLFRIGEDEASTLLDAANPAGADRTRNVRIVHNAKSLARSRAQTIIDACTVRSVDAYCQTVHVSESGLLWQFRERHSDQYLETGQVSWRELGRKIGQR